MRISDEIDALEVMGVQPVTFLAATRLLAAWMTLPFMYLAAIGVGFFASYLAVVEQIGDTSSGGYFLIFWMFQNPPDLIFSVIKGDVRWRPRSCSSAATTATRRGRAGRRGHGDREVDGAQHRPRAHHRDDGDARVLGSQPASANRRLADLTGGGRKWLTRRRDRGVTRRARGRGRRRASGTDAADDAPRGRGTPERSGDGRDRRRPRDSARPSSAPCTRTTRSPASSPTTPTPTAGTRARSATTAARTRSRSSTSSSSSAARGS